MQNQRLSNIELLRIIAILMVIMLHYNANALHPEVIPGGDHQFSWFHLEGNIIESFCVVAVNIFVLISGYFAIKLSVRSVLNLYIRCLIIGVVTYLAYILITDEPVSLSALGGRVLAFTHNHWWFVISYLGLMAVSPILNAGCAHLDKKNYLIVLSLFAIIITYFGWWRRQEPTCSGYSLIHFIFMYVLARFINLHIEFNKIWQYRWLWGLLFIASCSTLSILPVYSTRYVYTYDNPIVILSAVSLLLFCISFPFYNKYINFAALSVFSAYLIQESPYFGRLWLYPSVSNIFSQNSHSFAIALFFAFSIATILCCILVDIVFVRPAIRGCNNILNYAEVKGTHK